MIIAIVLGSVFGAIGLLLLCYVGMLTLLTIPWIQDQVLYMHKWATTWYQDLNKPEQWGFLHNQITPFQLQTSDGETLHAWHILPISLYRRHETRLLAEPASLAPDITNRQCFKLLREDPDSKLVLYFHGAGSHMAEGFRPNSYRAVVGAAENVHCVAIDYRGFGSSTGRPSEHGLLMDALTLAEWALNVSCIPPERIVLFGHSLGTAVAIALAHHSALRQPKPTFFAGMVTVAAFADIASLTKDLRVFSGTIPLLWPVAQIPRLMAIMNSTLVSKWPSIERLPQLVRAYEDHASATGIPYDFSFLHAEDDRDVPWTHTDRLFWSAVDAIAPSGPVVCGSQRERVAKWTDLGAGGRKVEHRTKAGVIRERILKFGLHDVMEGYSVVTVAVGDAFEGPVRRRGGEIVTNGSQS